MKNAVKTSLFVRFVRVALAVAAVSIAGCLSGGGGGNENNTSPATNTAPIANAGVAQSVLVGTTVTLDGSTSSDGNGDALTFSWTLTSTPLGSGAFLSNLSEVKPTFTPDVAGIYQFALTVNDGKVSSIAVTVSVTAAIANATPVAAAGPVQNVITGTLVTLNGSGSTDANGDLLTFNWAFSTKPVSSAAQLLGATTAAPTFTPDIDGTYVVQLTVNDGQVSSVIDSVTIMSSTPNAAPVANAGPDQNVITGTLVTLNGGGSTDANGDLLTFNWVFSTKPASSTALLVGSTSAAPTFTPDFDGTYVVQLTVDDGQVSSQIDSVSVTSSTPNSAPVANAGPDQNIVVGAIVTLDGSASSDANGDPLTFSWNFISKPSGSVASLSSLTSSMPTFIADVAGIFAATLIVNDGQTSSVGDTVTINVLLPVPQPLPIGSGTYMQRFVSSEIYKINESTGVMSLVSNACQSFYAADIDPNGMVLAIPISEPTVLELDVITGACAKRFQIDEVMRAIAVAPDGTVTTISVETYFGAAQIYQYSANGTLLSKKALSGVSRYFATGLSVLTGIDYAPDGTLYGLNLGELWNIDPSTGVGVSVGGGHNGTWDIDIDSSELMREIGFGILYRTSGVSTTPLTLEKDFSHGFLISR